MKSKNNNLICIAKITVKQDKIDEALAAFTELMKLSAKEEGCFRFSLPTALHHQILR